VTAHASDSVMATLVEVFETLPKLCHYQMLSLLAMMSSIAFTVVKMERWSNFVDK